MLQKSIRRRRGATASRLAMELYRLSPTELLRRLPIIIIEDSILHPALPVVTWLLLAVSRGFLLPEALKLVLCLIAAETASSPARDIQARTQIQQEQSDDDRDQNGELEGLPRGIQRDLIASLLLRAAFGGSLV